MNEADYIRGSIVWLTKEHESQTYALGLYETGKMRSFIDQGRGMRNTTQESIQEARNAVAAIAANLSFLAGELGRQGQGELSSARMEQLSIVPEPLVAADASR